MIDRILVFDTETLPRKEVAEFVAFRLGRGAKIHVAQAGNTVSHCGRKLKYDDVSTAVIGKVRKDELCKKCLGAANEEFLASLRLKICDD